MKYHYIYRITNIIENKHYYGCRTCKNCKPSEDIGIKYFSSSTDKIFLKDQRENSQNYKYKVVFIFDNRTDALLREVRLHNIFDVGVNKNFYNRSKQTSTTFDTTGTNPFSQEQLEKISLQMKGRVFSEEHRKKLSLASKGKPKSKTHTENIRKNRPNVKGINHPRHKFVYVTPLGTYDSPAALDPIITLTRMKNFCINCDRLISQIVYKNCQWLIDNYDYDRDLKGKTYRDIGFYTS